MKKMMKTSYPQNLLHAVNAYLKEERVPETLTDDQQAGLAYIVNNLTERQKSIVSLIYSQGLTRREAGEALGLSVQECERIKNIALRRMSYQRNREFIILGYEAAMKAKEQREAAMKAETKDGTPIYKWSAIYRAHEPALSTRAENCLRQRGGYWTMEEVADALERGEVELIRGVGKKTLAEITAVVESFRKETGYGD